MATIICYGHYRYITVQFKTLSSSSSSYSRDGSSSSSSKMMPTMILEYLFHFVQYTVALLSWLEVVSLICQIVSAGHSFPVHCYEMC